MNTLVTTVTDRGQVSIPAPVRRALKLEPGARLVWEPAGDGECRVRLQSERPARGASAMRGYARAFRKVRATAEWMRELREGEAG